MHEVKNFGRIRGHDVSDVSLEEGFLLVSKVRIETYCSDAVCDRVVQVLRDAAHTGLRGDGKIFVSNVENAMRISNGDLGEAAI